MIRNCAVVNILKNCKLLEYLLLQGCKLLDENMLECFFEDDNNDNSSDSRYKFTNLKKIDLTKCDLIVDKDNPRKISLKWIGSYSGQFELKYGDYVKTIVVESLF